MADLEEDNKKLIEKFGAARISDIGELPDFYTFTNGLIYSHRDFDIYFKNLLKGEKSAIVSGFNASGTPHLGHLAVFDTNLFFQRKYGAKVYIPISDDESYVSLKVKTQEEALQNSFKLSRAIVALGFDLNNTKLIIDELYTDIYNYAIKLSRGVTYSEIRAIYGYTHDQNIGLHFYPTVQAAHIILPQILDHIKNVLVPIGPDEDSHLRTCRDLAGKFGYTKPAVLHSLFMPGVDGQKMSKSRGNAIFILDAEKEIRKKIMASFSGGATSIEEHRKIGGNPDVDIAYLYLKSYFLNHDESKQVYDDYKKGKLLSGELKNMLFEQVMKRVSDFRKAYEKVTIKDLEKVIMKNDDIDLQKLAEKAGIM